MGRAKLEMKLISKEKSRNTTYNKRKNGLIRKLHEFSTLCDVKACMIIYPHHGATQAEIFPPNPDQVREIIDTYKSKNKDSGIKSYGIADFFHEREKKINEELAKLRKKNMEAKYPTRTDMLNNATEPQLREFAVLLSNKLDHVRSTIELQRRNSQAAASSMDSRLAMRSGQSQFHGPSGVIEAMNYHHLHHQQPVINHHPPPPPVEMHVPFIDHHKSMMMLLMNDTSSSTNTNIQLQSQVFFQSAAPRPLLARYYAPPLPQPQPYMLSPPPHLLFSNHDGVQEEYIQYEMRNQTPTTQN